MKKCIPLLLLGLPFLFPVPSLSAAAETARYAFVPDANVWFYESESEEDKLFLIPETYYVRVLSEGDDFSAVEYLVNDPPYRKRVGYCRTDAIRPVDYVPARPFLRREIEVSYYLPDGGELCGGFGKIDRTFVYYGARAEGGQLYYYVLGEEGFGYITADAPLEFEKNDDYRETSGPAGEISPAPQAKEGLSAAEIVLICAACAAAVLFAVLVLRTRRPRSGDET